MLTKEHQNKQLGEPPLYTTPLLPDMGLNIKPALRCCLNLQLLQAAHPHYQGASSLGKEQKHDR